MPNDLMFLAGELHRPELDGYLVELASEAERDLLVLVVNGGAGMDTHVEGLVDGYQDWNGVRNFTGRNFLIVHAQDTGAG